jgi:DNA replication protein DnaC
MDFARPAPPPDVCSTCGGDGAVFRVKDGRAAAEPCAHTRGCPSCGGSGRVFAADERGYSVVRGCPCGADPRRLALLNGLRLPLKFLDRKLQNYIPDKTEQSIALGRACRFIDEFVPGATGIRALLFWGPPGTGKTHLLTSILRELALQKAVRGRYEEFFLLLSDVRNGFSNDVSARQWLEPLRSIDVLTIDELGKGGRNKEFEQGILDEIISVRYNAGRPTLFATNYRPTRLAWPTSSKEAQPSETLEERVGARIYSRLQEICDFILVDGPDRRMSSEQATRSSARTPSQFGADDSTGGPRSARG